MRHREDGPAIQTAHGNKEWWINDQRHREDGPAIETTHGNKEWWVNDQFCSEKEFVQLMKLKAFW
jgi:hypothetical protein